jgi:flagellar motor switch protein FliG
MSIPGSGEGSGGGKGGGRRIDGMGAAAELLNGLDPEHRKRLLGEVAKRDPKVAAGLEQRMFGFEDLRRLSDHDLQLVLREVPHSKLIVALRRATDELQEAFYRNMTSRAGEMLREEVRAQGPKRVSDIQSAQADILKIAQRLDAEGKVRLRGQ